VTALDSSPASAEALARVLAEGYRVVDLSDALIPGMMTADGRYLWPRTHRRFEIKQWISPGGHFQHFIEAASQVGTHVETPAHIVDGVRNPDGSPMCPGDVPLETFFGEAIVINCDDAQPREPGGRRYVEVEKFKDVRPGDIVLVWSHASGYADGPAISDEAGQYLADLPIKMIGEQAVFIPNPPHVSFLGREAGIIPIMEEIKHLEDVKHDRVFFFGVPVRVHRVEASWIRAFAFEPRT
jgi:kynurenine formamidase